MFGPFGQPSGCEQVCAVLEQAGDNGGELEKVLKHYKDRAEFQKLAAAEFLSENMPGQEYIIAGFYDEEGNVLPPPTLNVKLTVNLTFFIFFPSL